MRETDVVDRRREKYENIVIAETPGACPRCGCGNVNWVGGDMDGHGGYYHMYACEDCNRGSDAVIVFLVSCTEEDYGREPGTTVWTSGSSAWGSSTVRG